MSRFLPVFSAKTYLLLLVAAVLVSLVCLEFAVRKMPHAYCKAEVDSIYGCASFKSIKRYLGDRNSRFYLGDSHVEYMVDYNGFRDYSVPAMLPSEMLYIMKYLVRSRDVKHVVIGLSAHHLQDKRRTRQLPILDPGTLSRQYFPFPIYTLEPVLTVGLKKYLWDTLFNRPLPSIDGQQMYTEEELEQQKKQRWADQSLASQKAGDAKKLWWQDEALVLEETHWQQKNPKQRNDWALPRFRRHYPHADFKETDEHDSLVGLLDLLDAHEIKACFVNFPHAEIWKELAALPEFSRHNVVKDYLRKLIERRNYYYLDTDALDLNLTTEHFRDSDHLLIPVIEQLTPVIVDTCFPNLPPPVDS